MSASTAGGADRVGLPEAAAMLGVHYMTAYRYVRTGRLPATTVDGIWHIARSDVDLLRHRSARPRKRRVGGSRERSASLYRERAISGDEAGALAVCEEALATWATPMDLDLQVVAPAMRRIGDLWNAGELRIADEHRASAVTTRVLGRLGSAFVGPGRTRGTVVLGAVEDDHHALPVMLAADLLRAEQIRVVDLGADAPPEAFAVTASEADRLSVVAIGTTLSGMLQVVGSTVDAVRRVRPDVTIVVGGAGVESAELAAAVGADGWSGPDGCGLVELITTVVRTTAREDGRSRGPAPSAGRPVASESQTAPVGSDHADDPRLQ